MSPIRLALVGLGKIARDQHLPAITADPRFELAAVVSRNAELAAVPHFTKDRHFGFEGAAWYWHFVDVVWLGLYVVVYWM